VVLPGINALLEDGGGNVDFQVNADGTVDYAASLNNVLSGRGTSMLVVHGVTVNVDATALSPMTLGLDGFEPSFKPTTPFQIVVLPGINALLEDGGGYVDFQVNADGTVDYDRALDGVLSGRGTSTLIVGGVTLTIDATALSPLTATFTVVGLSTMTTAQAQTVTVLPGDLGFEAGTLAFDFTISAQDVLDYDPSLNGRLSGRGTNTLVVSSSASASTLR
jgi:hypothetical protein